MQNKIKVLIIILFVNILSIFANDSTIVYLMQSNTQLTGYCSTNQYTTTVIDVIIKCDKTEDSFAAIGLYINFDTKYLRAGKVEYNSNITLDLENNVNGSLTDSNGNIVKLQLNEFEYNYNSETINVSFFIVKPNLSPIYTNFHQKVLSIYFYSILSTETTYVTFNFTEPRKTTLSRDGYDQTDRYDTIAIKIDTAPPPPIISFPTNDYCTNVSQINITGTRNNTNDTIAIYVNHNLVKYDTTNSTTFSYVYTFTKQDTYLIYCKEINNYNNSSETSNIVYVIYDTTPPTILSYLPLNNAIVVDSNNDSITISYKEETAGIQVINIYLDTGSSFVNYTNRFTITSSNAFLIENLPVGYCTTQIYIKDRATNDTTLTFKFKIVSYNQPAAITLQTPINNYETEFVTSITFRWDTEINSETYQIQIDTNFNFINPIINIDTLQTNILTITNLPYNTYYWRVRGKNYLYNGIWSETRKFSNNKDLTKPEIKSILITDKNNDLNIDNSDIGIKITAFFNDNISLKTVSFSYGLNDTNYLTDNYSLDQPSTGTISHIFNFLQALNTGDKIYIKLTAMDNNYNETSYYDTIIVGAFSISAPIIIISDTTININPIEIRGTKQTGTTVKINNQYIATSISDTLWSYTYTLLSGTNVITARAYVGSVYSDTAEITIIYDNVKPTASINFDTLIHYDSFLVIITASDSETGIKEIYYSLNNGLTYIKGNSFYYDIEDFIYIKYFAVDNADNTSSIYTSLYPARIDRTPPQAVDCFDEGDLSNDTIIEFSWNLPNDSSPIIDFYIEIDTTPNFSPPRIFAGWLNSTNLSFILSGDSVINGETYYCRVKSKDIVNNISNFGNSSNGIYIDTTIIAGSAPDTPVIFYVGDTNVSVITLSGTYPANATIVLVNGSQADLISDTLWRKTVVLNDGLNNFVVYCKNQYGLSSPSNSISIYLDNIPPIAPEFNVTTPTRFDTQLIIGTKSIDSDTILVNGATAQILSNTQWQYLVTLTQYGLNTINVVAIDSFNNRSDTVSKQIFFDNIPPATPYLINYISPYAGINQIIEGGFDTSANSVKINNVSASINKETGRWIITISLNNEGGNNFTITAIDEAGNSSETNFVIIRDLTPPDKPDILLPENNITVTASPITVSGTVAIGTYGVYINDKLETNIVNNTFACSVALVQGANVITAKAIDELGNASPVDAIIIYYEPLAFLIYAEQLEGKSELPQIPDSIYINSTSIFDTTTINSTNITITNKGNNIPINFVFTSNYNGFYIIPTSGFQLEEFYTLSIKSNVKNIDGKNLYQNYTWTFKTGIDDIKPEVTNFYIRDDEGLILIDNSDVGVILYATVADTGVGLKMVRFDIGLNDTTYSTNNYTYTYPSNQTFTRYFTLTLNTGDIIYYRVYAEDKVGNYISYSDSISVGAVIIPVPTLDNIDTTVNYSPILLSGSRYYEASVYVNGIKSLSIDTDKWQINLSLFTGMNQANIIARVGSSQSQELNVIIIYDTSAPTATHNAPTIPKNTAYYVTITGQDNESGIKKIFISLNDGHFIETNVVYINQEYKNKIMYVVENNCEVRSDTYTIYCYYDITPPAIVKTIDEGTISNDTILIWYWEVPLDSSPIDTYYIQISNKNDFSNIIFDTFILDQKTFFRITGDMCQNIIVGETYYARVIAYDRAGNKSDTGSQIYWSDGIFIDTGFVDNIPPDKPKILFPIDGINTNVTTITVSGTAPIDAVIVIINGQPLTIGADTSWSRTISLAYGKNEILVSAKDEFGNESEADTIVVYMDNIPPFTPILDDTILTITNDSRVVISGIKEFGSNIIINGSSVGIISSDTRFSKIFIQAEGTTVYQIISIDTYGNISDTRTISITVDLTPPQVPTVNYIGLTNKTTQIINGTMEAGTQLYINDTTTNVLISGGNWSYELTLQEGANTFVIKSIDRASNFSETTIIIILDITPPDNPIITYPYNGFETAESPIKVEGRKPIESYVYVNGILANGNYNDTYWFLPALSLTSGVNLITATTRDNLGNESPGSKILVNFNINLFLVTCPLLDNDDKILKPDSITLQLNKEPNIATINTSNIYLLEDNVQKSINIQYDALLKQIHLLYNFKANSYYTLNVRKSVTSIEGTQLTQDRNWNFRILINKNDTAEITLSNIKININANSIDTDNFYILNNSIPLSDGRIITANNKLSEISTFWQTLGVSAIVNEITCYFKNEDTFTNFNKPIELYIYYSDIDNDGKIDNTDLFDENNYIFKLDENENKWVRLESENDTNLNYTKVSIERTGIFTILSSNKIKLNTSLDYLLTFDNNNILINVPKNSLQNNSYFDIEKINPAADIVKTANSKFDGSNSFFKTFGLNSIIYNISSYTIDGVVNNQFNTDIIITIYYPDNNQDGIIDNTNLLEENIFANYLNTDSDIWECILTTEINNQNNFVSAKINKTGYYTLLSSNHKRLISNEDMYFYLNNNKIEIFVPKNSIDSNIYFTFSSVPLTESKIKLANNNLEKTQGFYRTLGLNTIIYDINCYTIFNEQRHNFNNNIIISFYYDDNNQDGIVDGTNVSEKLLKPFVLNENLSQWEIIDNYSVDENSNKISFEINHLSTFGILSSSVNLNEVWLFPNPTSNKKINLLCRPIQDEYVKITIVTPLGYVVYKNEFFFNSINPAPVELDLKDLVVGAYFAIIKFSNYEKVLGIGIAK